MQEQITVQCTEFDNARHDYLEYLDRGEDYLPVLRSMLEAEYDYYADSCTPEELKKLQQNCETFLFEVESWARSSRMTDDREFVRDVRRKVSEEFSARNAVQPDSEMISVYLAGDDDACLSIGDNDSGCRFVYSRANFDECIRLAVAQYIENQEEKKRSSIGLLVKMQQALSSARTMSVAPSPSRIKRCICAQVFGQYADYIDDLIGFYTGKKKRRKSKVFSADIDQLYQQFISYLIEVVSPLIMHGDDQSVCYSFQVSIPQEGKISVSWDAPSCTNYLYAQTFDIAKNPHDELRIWWSSSCMSEMKRLKEKEIEIRQKFNF